MITCARGDKSGAVGMPGSEKIAGRFANDQKYRVPSSVSKRSGGRSTNAPSSENRRSSVNPRGATTAYSDRNVGRSHWKIHGAMNRGSLIQRSYVYSMIVSGSAYFDGKSLARRPSGCAE